MAHGEASSFKNRAHRPGGDGESSPRGGRSILYGPWGGIILQENRAHRPGETGSPAQGVVGASFMAHGEASSFRKTGHTGLGGRGFQPRGWSEHPLWPMGRHHPSGKPGTPAWGDGESSPGDGRSILHGPWGGIILHKPGTPAWGGRGVQPRGWSEHPSWPMGRHHPSKTGHTGLGGAGSSAQGVVGASFMAHGEASSFKNRAHRPGGGRGVQPRGWSEHPSWPMGRPIKLCSKQAW